MPDDFEDVEALWQTEARKAIESAMVEARFDKSSKTIFVPVEHESGHTYEEAFTKSEDLWTHLEQVGEQEWHGYVPYDGGEPVFEPDVEDYLSDVFEKYKVEAFLKR